MAIVFLQLPPALSPAFNPIRVVVQTPKARYAQLVKDYAATVDAAARAKIKAEMDELEAVKEQETLDPLRVMVIIGDNTDNRSVTLERMPDKDGKAVFDLSHIMRHAFIRKTYKPYDYSPVYWDFRLYSRLIIEDDHGLVGSFKVINAVLQPGYYDGNGLSGYRALTDAAAFTRYPGYPLEVAVLAQQDMSINFYYALMNDIGGGVANRLYPPLCVVPLDAYLDSRFELRKTMDGAAVATYPVKMGCVPDAPFYVRWINRQGGYDSYMFSRRKQYTQQVEQVDNILRAYDDAGNDAQQTVGLSASRTVTAGVDGLTDGEFDLLAGIALSPAIEWYNEQLGAWQTIVLADDNTLTRDTASGLNGVEFVFGLPPLLTQF